MRVRLCVLLSVCLLLLITGVGSAFGAVPQQVGKYDYAYQAGPDGQNATCTNCHLGVASADLHHALGLPCADCHNITLVDGHYLATIESNCVTAGCHNTIARHDAALSSTPQCAGAGCHSSDLIGTFNSAVPSGPTTDRTPTVNRCRGCHIADTSAQPHPVLNPTDTHHSFSFPDSTRCLWCHSFGDPAPIRACQRCHSAEHLHAIAGHNSSSEACSGCHGDGPMPPLTPHTIEAIQPSPASVGQIIEITGSRLTQVTDVFFVSSAAEETAAECLIESDTCMQVTIAQLTPGVYTLVLLDSFGTRAEASVTVTSPFSHIAPSSACVYCHGSNVQITHHSECDWCHKSNIPSVIEAMEARNIDCRACHSIHGTWGVNSIDPESGYPGEVVTASGNWLLGAVSVTLSGPNGTATVPCTVKSDYEFTFQVPELPSGTYSLEVVIGWQTVPAPAFTVLGPPCPTTAPCDKCHTPNLQLDVSAQIESFLGTDANTRIACANDEMTGWGVADAGSGALIASDAGSEGLITLPFGKHYTAWVVTDSGTASVAFDTIGYQAHDFTSECARCHAPNLIDIISYGDLRCEPCHQPSVGSDTLRAVDSCYSCHPDPWRPQNLQLDTQSGLPGTLVTMTGDGLWLAEGIIVSRMGQNGVYVEPINRQWNQMTFLVPKLTPGTYDVGLDIGHGPSPLTQFTVTCEATSLSPARGPSGTEVIIEGTNFGPSAEAAGGSIDFGEEPAAVLQWTDSSITAVVPAGLPAGAVDVVVHTDAGPTMPLGFTFVPAPVIDELIPQSALPGETVMVKGSGFSWDTASVLLTGAEAPPILADFTVVDDSTLRVTVPKTPPGMRTVTITTEGGTASTTCAVGCRITKISASTVKPGDWTFVDGINFGPAQGPTVVTFNGIPATEYSQWTDARIRCRVPSGIGKTDCLVQVKAPGYTSVPIRVKAR